MTPENIEPYNPLDKRHLGESVGAALLRDPVTPLDALPEFLGAGIYAIYYSGEFECYSAIAALNQGPDPAAPVYVGKAVPKGARKGGDLEPSHGRALYSRPHDHRKCIQQAENLDTQDFTVRFLVVDDIWIPLGESLLIARHSPIWNVLIDGFGNHDPGKRPLQRFTAQMGCVASRTSVGRQMR